MAGSERVKALINPALLVWVRRIGGFKKADLAKSLSVSLAKWEDWESGKDQPTPLQVIRIAKRVKRPIALFYREEPPIEPAPPRDLRTAPGATRGTYSSSTLLEIRKARVLQSRLRELINDLQIEWTVNLPTASVSDDAESFSRSLRDLLGVSLDLQLSWNDHGIAYRQWRDRLGALGVLSTQFSIRYEDCLGFAIWDDLVPLAAVNSRQAVAKRVFTLWHEVAHLCLRLTAVADPSETEPHRGTSPDDVIETFCDQVAASLLMPNLPRTHSALSQIVVASSMTRDDARRVAQQFGVSKYVVLRRAFEFELLPARIFHEVTRSWLASDAAEQRRRSEEPKKPIAIPRPTIAISRKGRRAAGVFLEALDRNRLTHQEVAEALELREDHLDGLRLALASGSTDEEDA